MSSAPLTLPTAQQAALAVSHEAVYGYGIVGARGADDDRTHALACLVAHERVRDALTAQLSAAGLTPVAAQAAYQLPFPVRGAAAARRLAATLEDAACGSCWDLVAVSLSGSGVRVASVGWLVAAGVRARSWGSVRALPGRPG